MRKIFIISLLVFSCQNKPLSFQQQQFIADWQLCPDSLKELLSRQYFIESYKSSSGKITIDCSLLTTHKEQTYNNEGNYKNGSDIAINPEIGAVDLNDSLPAGL